MHLLLSGRNFLRLFLGVLVFLCAVTPSASPGAAAPIDALKAGGVRATSAEMKTYLPLLWRYVAPRPSVFGAETYDLTDAKTGYMQQANMYWLRNTAISWTDIEPVRTTQTPTYNWSVVDDAGLARAASKGLTTIATVKFIPVWARQNPTKCGPIAPDRLDEYAQFMAALVTRYSQKPYRIKYWELGNEPDVDPDISGPNGVFGCWGNDSDPYYGGGYYATMLQAVYPAMKAADPQSHIMIGGLLLDCDWTNPPAGRDCLASKFFEGILRNNGMNDGANYFDSVAFHSFANYTGSIDEASGHWAHRGGMILGKVDFLREVMTGYGVNKPLILNETALVCPTWMGSGCNPVPNAFLEKQADYVSWLYTRAWATGLIGAVWYPLENSDWQASGLHHNGVIKPVYYAYQFTANELAGAVYAGAVTDYAGVNVTGYAFTKPGKRIWVLWSSDQANHAITIPAAATVVYDKYGATLMSGGGPITINSPIYVELTP